MQRIEVGESSGFYFIKGHPGVWLVKPTNETVTSKGRSAFGIDMGGVLACPNRCLFCKGTPAQDLIDLGFNSKNLVRNDERTNVKAYQDQMRLDTNEILDRLAKLRRFTDIKPSQYVITRVYGETISDLQRLKEIGRGLTEVKKTFGDTNVRTRINTSAVLGFTNLSGPKELAEIFRSSNIDEVAISLNAINSSARQEVMRTKQKYRHSDPFDEAISFALTAKENGMNVFFSFVDKYHPGEERVREFCQSHGVSPIFRPLSYIEKSSK